ncbi:acyltransferase family protein [Paenibacillus sp. FSL R10-2734]|uniref:acyltransferase family protein n=1 Tax=Paenibacillus sp. FSL R10-2734 TaxID=2954691 RepID=UPI0030DD0458
MSVDLNVNKRVDWVDIFKGLIIMMVVLGHENGFLVKYIYLFHMPAFFFISGYTAKLNKQSFFTFTKERFLRLIVPVYCINILFFLFRWVMNLLGFGLVFYSEPMNASDFLHSIYNLFALNITSDLAGVSWFFIVLFLASVLLKLVHDIFRGKKLAIAATSILLFVVGYWFVRHNIRFPKTLFDLVLIAQFYFMCGRLLSESGFMSKIKFNIDILACILVILIYPLYYFANIYWGGTDYPSRSFGNPIINVISAFIGITATIAISYLLRNIRILKWIFIKLGEITLAIAFMHFLAFRVFFGILYLLNIVDRSQVQQLIPSQNANYQLVLFIFTIAFCWIINFILQKNDVCAALILGVKTKPFNRISSVLDYIFKPLLDLCVRLKLYCSNQLSAVIPYIKQRPILFIFMFIIIGYKIVYFMRPWINVNDELLILISSQKGLGSIYEYIANVSLSQGRAYFLGNLVALIIFTIKNVYVFRIICLLILVSNIYSFILLCNKIWNNTVLSWMLCFLFFVSLTFSWEPAIPNAYITFYGVSITALFLSLRYFYLYIENKQTKFIVLSILGYILCLFTYELFIIFAPLYLLIAMSRIKGLKKSIYKVLPIIISTAAYIVIYLIWRKLFGSGYEGAKVDLASFSIVDCLRAIVVIGLSALPGALLLISKYRYIYFDLYGDQQFQSKYLNIIAQVFTVQNVILGLLAFYIFYKLLQESRRVVFSNRMIIYIGIAAVYIFIPSTILAVTPLYQEAVKNSSFITLNASYFSLFACILFFCLLVIKLLQRVGSEKKQKLVIFLGAAFIAMMCILSNFQSDTITKHQNYLKQRLSFINSFINSDSFRNIQDGAVIYAPSIFKSEMSLAIHDSFWDEYTKIRIGKNVHFTKELPDSSVHNPVYYLKDIELDSSQERYLVFGKIDVTNQHNDYLSDDALVIYSGKQRQHIIEGKVKDNGIGEISLNDQGTTFMNGEYQISVRSQDAFTSDQLPGSMIFALKGQKFYLNSIRLVTGHYESYDLHGQKEGNTLATGTDKLGWYAPESNGSGTWMSKEASVRLLTGQAGSLIVKGYMTDYIDSNEIAILVDGVEMGRQTVRKGEFTFNVKVPVDKSIKVTLEAGKTMIPADLNINKDTRELSVLITSIKAE